MKHCHPAFEHVPNVSDRYVYRIKTTRRGSQELGPCEICGKHAPEVFYQVEGLTYLTDELDDCGPGKIQVTYAGTQSLFGHEECLRNARR